MYTAVYAAMFTAAHMCTRPVHGCVHDRVDRRVLGRVHGLYAAAYTYTRPAVYETNRIFNFLTNSCDYCCKQSKAPYCLTPVVYPDAENIKFYEITIWNGVTLNRAIEIHYAKRYSPYSKDQYVVV